MPSLAGAMRRTAGVHAHRVGTVAEKIRLFEIMFRSVANGLRCSAQGSLVTSIVRLGAT